MLTPVGVRVGPEKLFGSLTEYIGMLTPVGVTGGAGEAV